MAGSMVDTEMQDICTRVWRAVAVAVAIRIVVGRSSRGRDSGRDDRGDILVIL